jgi:hypothetical protein
MTERERDNLFLRHPERAQMLFLSCLERARTIDEISRMFKVSPSLFYVDDVIYEATKRGILKSEQIGRKIYYVSVFNDEFWDYFKKILYIARMKKEYIIALEKDLEKLKTIFDNPNFRLLWNENVLMVLKPQDFKQQDLILALFTLALVLISSITETLEKTRKVGGKITFEEIKTINKVIFRGIFSGSYPLLADVIEQLSNNITEPVIAGLKDINKTEFYKVVVNEGYEGARRLQKAMNVFFNTLVKNSDSQNLSA